MGHVQRLNSLQFKNKYSLNYIISFKITNKYIVIEYTNWFLYFIG